MNNIHLYIYGSKVFLNTIEELNLGYNLSTKEETNFNKKNNLEFIDPLGKVDVMAGFTLKNGATAYLPGSCNMKIDYRDLEEFRDVYNDMLVDSGTQFLSKPGDVLMYDSRTLHSTMPNNSNEFRSALLINILEKDIIPRVRELDNNTDFVKT